MKRMVRAGLALGMSVCLAVTAMAVPTDVSAKKKAPAPKKITLNKKSVKIQVGKKFTVKVKKIKPKKASKKASAFKFKSSKKKIATVSKKGVIKGKKVGSCKVTVTSKTKKKVKATIKVKVIKKTPVTPTVTNPPVVASTAPPAGPGTATTTPPGGPGVPTTDAPATNPPGPATNPPGPATNPPGPATNPPGPATNPPGPATNPPGPATNSPGPATNPPGPATNPPGPATNPPGPATQGPETPEPETPEPPAPATIRPLLPNEKDVENDITGDMVRCQSFKLETSKNYVVTASTADGRETVDLPLTKLPEILGKITDPAGVYRKFTTVARYIDSANGINLVVDTPDESQMTKKVITVSGSRNNRLNGTFDVSVEKNSEFDMYTVTATKEGSSQAIVLKVTDNGENVSISGDYNGKPYRAVVLKNKTKVQVYDKDNNLLGQIVQTTEGYDLDIESTEATNRNIEVGEDTTVPPTPSTATPATEEPATEEPTGPSFPEGAYLLPLNNDTVTDENRVFNEDGVKLSIGYGKGTFFKIPTDATEGKEYDTVTINYKALTGAVSHTFLSGSDYKDVGTVLDWDGKIKLYPDAGADEVKQVEFKCSDAKITGYKLINVYSDSLEITITGIAFSNSEAQTTPATEAPATAEPATNVPATEAPATAEPTPVPEDKIISLKNASAEAIFGNLSSSPTSWQWTNKGFENADGSMTFHTSAIFSGTGMCFYINEDKTPFDASSYSKIQVTVSSPSEDRSLVMGVRLGDADSSKKLEKYAEPAKGKMTTYEFDLSSLTADEIANLSKVEVKFNAYQKPTATATEDEQRAYMATFNVHSIVLLVEKEAPAPTDVPATSVPATNVPATSVPATNVPATSVPATDVPATSVPATDVPATSVPATNVPATSVPATDVPATSVPATDVPATSVPATDVPATSVPATDVPATEAPGPAEPDFPAGSYLLPLNNDTVTDGNRTFNEDGVKLSIGYGKGTFFKIPTDATEGKEYDTVTINYKALTGAVSHTFLSGSDYKDVGTVLDWDGKTKLYPDAGVNEVKQVEFKCSDAKITGYKLINVCGDSLEITITGIAFSNSEAQTTPTETPATPGPATAEPTAVPELTASGGEITGQKSLAQNESAVLTLDTTGLKTNGKIADVEWKLSDDSDKDAISLEVTDGVATVTGVSAGKKATVIAVVKLEGEGDQTLDYEITTEVEVTKTKCYTVNTDVVVSAKGDAGSIDANAGFVAALLGQTIEVKKTDEVEVVFSIKTGDDEESMTADNSSRTSIDMSTHDNIGDAYAVAAYGGVLQVNNNGGSYASAGKVQMKNKEKFSRNTAELKSVAVQIGTAIPKKKAVVTIEKILVTPTGKVALSVVDGPANVEAGQTGVVEVEVDDGYTLVWTSQEPTLATVEPDSENLNKAIITGISAGTATIVVQVKDANGEIVEDVKEKIEVTILAAGGKDEPKVLDLSEMTLINGVTYAAPTNPDDPGDKGTITIAKGTSGTPNMELPIAVSIGDKINIKVEGICKEDPDPFRIILGMGGGKGEAASIVIKGEANKNIAFSQDVEIGATGVNPANATGATHLSLKEVPNWSGGTDKMGDVVITKIIITYLPKEE